jgi:3-keto-5-aminohexanoate cleavage enzyme
MACRPAGTAEKPSDGTTRLTGLESRDRINGVPESTPLIIEVRHNETADRELNRAIPYEPKAVVDDALAVVDAGASIVHWHARDTEGHEHPGQVELYREVVTGIRAHTNVVLHPTLGFVGTQGDAAGRVRHILELQSDPKTQIDIVPVDFGAFSMDVWAEDDASFLTDDKVMVNKVGYLRALLQILQTYQLKVMSVMWSPGGVRTALRLRETGVIDAPGFWMLGFTGDAMPGGMPASLTSLRGYLDVIPAGEPWTVHVARGDCMSMAAWAITLGGHVSIGIGDDPYLRLGAPTNSDLVRRVAQLAETIGRPVATITQTREILGLR